MADVFCLSPDSRVLQIEHIDQATICVIGQTALWKEEVVQVVADELLRLVEGLGPRHYVLSFLGVLSLSSRMLGRLISLGRRIRQTGGQLTLCSLTPELVERFVAMRLDRLFRICATEEEALGL